MARYIDADALVKRLKHSPLFLGTNMQFKDGVIDLVERQPTADVVEVVRCGECLHHDDCICVVCEEGETVVCKRESRHVRKDFSCIYGRRSESNGRE